MTPDQDWFYTYEPIFVESMFIENDYVLEIVGFKIAYIWLRIVPVIVSLKSILV